jgi:hypothetical protein
VPISPAAVNVAVLQSFRRFDYDALCTVRAQKNVRMTTTTAVAAFITAIAVGATVLPPHSCVCDAETALACRIIK